MEHEDIKHSRYPNHIQGLIPSIGKKAAQAPAITKIQDQVAGQFFLKVSGDIPGRAFSFFRNFLRLKGTDTLCRVGVVIFSNGPVTGNSVSLFSRPPLPGTGGDPVHPGSGLSRLVFRNESKR